MKTHPSKHLHNFEKSITHDFLNKSKAKTSALSQNKQQNCVKKVGTARNHDFGTKKTANQSNIAKGDQEKLNNDKKTRTKSLHLPDDAFYNADQNLLYVKKGDNTDDTIKCSLNAITEYERQNISTAPSDEEYSSKRSSPQRFYKTGSYEEFDTLFLESMNVARSSNLLWKRSFETFSVYFGQEEIFNESPSNTMSPVPNRKRCQSLMEFSYYEAEIQYFGGSELKNGPTASMLGNIPKFVAESL